MLATRHITFNNEGYFRSFIIFPVKTETGKLSRQLYDANKNKVILHDASAEQCIKRIRQYKAIFFKKG